MKRLAAVCGLAVALACAGSASAAGPTLTVQTSVSPPWLYFGDTVTTRVDVLFNPGLVDARSISLTPSFGIWAENAPERSATSISGATGRRTWWFSISCLTFACVPKGTTVQPFRLPAVTVVARGLDGTRVKVTRPWPALNVSGRFLPPALPNVRPAMRVQAAVPAPTYRLSPTLLADALDAVGGLLIAAALGFAAFRLSRGWLRGHAKVDTRPPLARALALVREAEGRQPDDRRRAVGLLARTLPEEGNGLTALASEVAWSKPDPSPTRLEELARTVETELEEPR